MGLLTASTATGQLVFLPLLATVIDRHGWRAATLVVAAAAALAIPPVALLLRERPAEIDLPPLSLLALMGIFDLIGTTGAGWLSDRWSSRGLLGWYDGLRGLPLFFLPIALNGSQAGL